MHSISCVCPTFGRLELLNEAVESFLRQDYKGEKELVVLNDASWFTIKFEHPEVSVYNLSARCSDMGTKWNVLISIAQYDVIVPWPDDDIMLPWTLTTINEKLGSNEYIQPRGFWKGNRRGIKRHKPGILPGIIAFKKSLWWNVGGFPRWYSGQDQGFLRRIRRKVGKNIPVLTVPESFFIYRYGGYGPHLSGKRTKKLWLLFEDKMMSITKPGVYRIEPTWKQDYVAMVRGA